MVTALRPRWKLCEVLPVVGMAKSSYEYARSAQAKGETEGRAAARKAVIEAVFVNLWLVGSSTVMFRI